jgi:hypothetical protein
LLVIHAVYTMPEHFYIVVNGFFSLHNPVRLTKLKKICYACILFFRKN